MKADTIIIKANIYLNEENHRQLVCMFLEKFSQCEVYVRPILKEYFLKEDPNIKDEEIPLNAKQILYACSENGIYFADKKIINKVFANNDKAGESSCRWLRNKITHSLMKRALEEVCGRFEELINDMDTFINEINK